MKKTFRKLFTILTMTTTVLALAGCTSSGNVTETTKATEPTSASVEITDVYNINEELFNNGVFGDTLEAIDSSYIEMLMKIPPTEYVSATVYMSSGATAERLAVFETTDSTAAKALVNKCQEHIAEQTEAYAGYMPAEVDKLNNAIIVSYDKYTILCVATDYENANRIILSHVN